MTDHPELRTSSAVSCSRKVGNGYCIPTTGDNLYNNCYNYFRGYTLKECQFVAENAAATVVGLHSNKDGYCSILFQDDPSGLACPTGFVASDNFRGAGPIAGATGDSNLECFACDNSQNDDNDVCAGQQDEFASNDILFSF